MPHEREALRQENGQCGLPARRLLLAWCRPLPVVARLVARLRAAHPALRSDAVLAQPRPRSGIRAGGAVDRHGAGLCRSHPRRGVRARVWPPTASAMCCRPADLRRARPRSGGWRCCRWRTAALPLGIADAAQPPHRRRGLPAQTGVAGAAGLRDQLPVLAAAGGDRGGAVAASIMPACSPGCPARMRLEIVPLVEPRSRVTMACWRHRGGRLSLAQQAALGCVATPAGGADGRPTGGADAADAVDAAVHHSSPLSGGSPT